MALPKYSTKKTPASTAKRKKESVVSSKTSTATPLVIDIGGYRKRLQSVLELVKRELKDAPQSSRPAGVLPMLATVTPEAFNDKNWQFEIKWDGYRAMGSVGEEVELTSRNGLSFNQKFWPVHSALKEWPINAVVDGEIVVLDEKGKADFAALQQWTKTAKGHLYYYLFDLLWLDGLDLTRLPLHRRRAVLKKLVPDEGPLRFSDSIDECGTGFFEAAKNGGLEGIIAKDKNSVYEAGTRTKSWLKIKAEQRHEAVICGYTKNKGSNRLFSSLVLGLPGEKGWQCIGQVGTGFTAATQRALFKRLNPLFTDDCPFTERPYTGAPTQWVEPQIICEVKYTELTPDGLMRHPSFQGIREDKTAEALYRETSPTPHKKAVKKEDSEPDELLSGTAKEATITIDKHSLQFTNLQTEVWRGTNITKAGLLSYYHQIASCILPYLQDRPLAIQQLLQAKGASAKNWVKHLPSWINSFSRHRASTGEEEQYVIAADEASLLYLVNEGLLDLCSWHSTKQSPDHPDWAIITLDGSVAPWASVVQTAQAFNDLLQSLHIPSYPKTFGEKNLQLYIPLGGSYTYTQAQTFTELICHLLHQAMPAITTMERTAKNRNGKVYLNHRQNRPLQTAHAPYAVQAANSFVSAPLYWAEVTKSLKPQDFTISAMPARLKQEGDLFEGVLGTGIRLASVIKKLSVVQ